MGPAQPELKKVRETPLLFTEAELERARLRSLDYYLRLEESELVNARHDNPACWFFSRA